jgi:hypothetical protein
MTALKVQLLPYAEGDRHRLSEIVSLYTRSGWGDNFPPDEAHAAFLKGTTLLAIQPCVDLTDNPAKAPLVGLLRGFTDGLFVAWIGEVIVDPAMKKQGIGKALVEKFVSESGARAVYLEALGDSHGFFATRGFKARDNLKAMSMLVKGLPAKQQRTKAEDQPGTFARLKT